MTGFRAFFDLLARAPQAKVWLLFALMALLGLTEGIGLVLLVPLLGLLYESGDAGNNLTTGISNALEAIGLSPQLLPVLTLFVALIAFRAAIQVLHEYIGTNLKQELVDGLRQECLERLLRADWRWTSQRRQSDHVNHIVTNVNRVSAGLTVGLSFIVLALTSSFYLAVAFSLNTTMTSLALVSGGGIFLLLAWLRRSALRLGEALGGANRTMQATVQESLTGIKIAKILRIESVFTAHFKEVTARLRRQQVAFATTSAFSRALFNTLGAALLAIYLYIAVTFLDMPLPALLVLVFIFARLIPNFMAAQRNAQQWLFSMPAWTEVKQLLEDTAYAAEPQIMSGCHVRFQHQLTLNNVTVSYATREAPALENITLTIKARTTVAVVGASGAGKSTLADAMMGLIEPDSGSITVDDVKIQGPDRIAWRSSVAYVPQEIILFHDTIAANLRRASARASNAELTEVLHKAAADFVFDLPQGLDTVIGDGGVLLSGGEKQRLALARALLHKPDLLILDEATSALDLANETRIRHAVEQLHGDLTVVIMGHRLAFLEKADAIIVLDQGRVKKIGVWEDVKDLL